MKKIVIPTDFSEASRNAFRFGEALAETLNSEIKVIHYCHPNLDSVDGFTSPNIDDLVNLRKSQLKQFVHAEEANNIEKVVLEEMIDREVIVGFANTQLIELSKNPDLDLIVMGTTGQSNLLRKMFGSISSHVSQNAYCPVLLVPPEAQFTGIDNILYASNYESADNVMMQKIVQFADPFNANIHLVHVNETSNKGEYELGEILLEQIFRRAAPSLEFRMSTVHSKTVWEGLFRYTNEWGIDLVVMVTRHRTFWENLRHASHTKAMVLNTKVPILVMHLDDKP